MGRVPVEATKKHLTKEEIERKKIAEEAITTEKDQLKIYPEWLVNEVAINEWKRIVSQLTEKSMIGNLDYNNLGAYCNAFTKWKDITEKLKMDILVAGEVNPLVSMELKYSDEMKKFGNLLGLSIESRLAKGKIIQSDGDIKIESKLGAI